MTKSTVEVSSGYMIEKDFTEEFMPVLKNEEWRVH